MKLIKISKFVVTTSRLRQMCSLLSQILKLNKLKQNLANTIKFFNQPQLFSDRYFISKNVRFYHITVRNRITERFK